MLRHTELVVLISARTRAPSTMPTPSGVARCSFWPSAWNRAELGSMRCSARTQRAISGSRARPWSVKALPPKPVPMSLSRATELRDLTLERRATSVAVTPRERARSQATRSVESARMRSVCATGGSSQRERVGCIIVTPLLSLSGATRPPRRSSSPNHCSTG